jgi:hypothetical protein
MHSRVHAGNECGVHVLCGIATGNNEWQGAHPRDSLTSTCLPILTSYREKPDLRVRLNDGAVFSLVFFRSFACCIGIEIPILWFVWKFAQHRCIGDEASKLIGVSAPNATPTIKQSATQHQFDELLARLSGLLSKMLSSLRGDFFPGWYLPRQKMTNRAGVRGLSPTAPCPGRRSENARAVGSSGFHPMDRRPGNGASIRTSFVTRSGSSAAKDTLLAKLYFHNQ